MLSHFQHNCILSGDLFIYESLTWMTYNNRNELEQWWSVKAAEDDVKLFLSRNRAVVKLTDKVTGHMHVVDSTSQLSRIIKQIQFFVCWKSSSFLAVWPTIGIKRIILRSEITLFVWGSLKVILLSQLLSCFIKFQFCSFNRCFLQRMISHLRHRYDSQRAIYKYGHFQNSSWEISHTRYYWVHIIYL